MKTLYFALGIVLLIAQNTFSQNTFPYPSTGNIGIGTTSPSAPLQIQASGINGSVQLGPWVNNSTAGSIYLNNDFLNSNTYNFLSAPASPLYINRASGQSVRFRENNGDDQLLIAPGGNVGIGTTTPGDLLVVNGAIRTTVNSSTGYGSYGGGLVAFDQSSGGNNIFSLVRQTNNLAISAWDGIGLTAGAYSPSTNYQMFLNSAGKVGIGTTTPQELLQVTGNIAAQAAAGPENTYFTFKRAYDGYTGARIGNAYEMLSYQGSLVFETNNGGGATSLIEAMRINSAGRVGIGTTTPSTSAKLSVVSSNTPISYGTGQIVAYTNDPQAADVGGQIVLGGSYTGTSETTFAAVSGRKENSTNANIAGYLSLGTNQEGVGMVERMRITSTGNIGIGTSDPRGFKLAVNGDMITTSIKVKLYANWPDYVFEPNYNLKPLSEVKTYIDQNHRLPEMPSEKEVADKGLDLGEINKLLTKKVEELTLYLIDQQKQMKEMSQLQQQQIDDLKKEVRSLKKDR